MKVSKEQAAANHERILDVAARLYREKGFDGVGVADIMKSAGLTHGGFYGHFASKEELMAQVVTRTQATAVEQLQRTVGDENALDENALKEFTDSYLSIHHRDNSGGGCMFASLGAEASRQSPPVRHAFVPGFNGMIDWLTQLVAGKSKAAKREKALATYATLVGALVLARSIDDETLSEEILNAAKASLSN